VIERSQVRLLAGALPGSLGQLSLPSLQGRYIKYQLTGIHLCRVADNTVIPYDKWRPVAVRWEPINSYMLFYLQLPFYNQYHHHYYSHNHYHFWLPFHQLFSVVILILTAPPRKLLRNIGTGLGVHRIQNFAIRPDPDPNRIHQIHRISGRIRCTPKQDFYRLDAPMNQWLQSTTECVPHRFNFYNFLTRNSTTECQVLYDCP